MTVIDFPPPRVCVVGSVNMDLVVRAPRFPVPGETLPGGVFDTFPGGKGANQAVAAARQGVAVSMIGCVGELYGEELLRVLEGHGVDVGGMFRIEGAASGVGVITVVPSGENAIVVASGANARLGRAEVEHHAERIASAGAVVMQRETTAEANAAAVEIARGAKTVTILNAAPAGPVAADLLGRIDLVIANRVEAAMLTGLPESAPVADLVAGLHRLGIAEAVVTLGAEGAVHSDGTRTIHRDAFPVAAVDTTACGDAFVGAFAASRAERQSAPEALRRGCAAGALAALAVGAIPSLPDRDAVESLLAASRSSSP